MRRLGCERRKTRDKEERPVAAEIVNNDDCNITVVNAVDVALELTRIYLQYHSTNRWVNEDTVYEVYKGFKEKIEKEGNESEEDED